jgi:hypothetical protein
MLLSLLSDYFLLCSHKNIFHVLLPSHHHLLHVTMLRLLPNCAVHHHCRHHAMRQTEVQNDLQEGCVT